MAQLTAEQLYRIRRSRRYPSVTQFDYLHARTLLEDLSATLSRLGRSGDRVLDVFCGSRPYEDLFTPGVEVIGFDVENNPYGQADVVSNEFLPFPDDSFEGVLCTQAFDYLTDPQGAVQAFRRVLRPGGFAVVTVPLVWEYDREEGHRRYSGPGLAALFDGWRDVQVIENGGRAVAWATMTGSVVHIAERRFTAAARRLVHPLFVGTYVLINVVALGLDAAERRHARGPKTLPMNLMLVAHAPEGNEAVAQSPT
jgi:SAM-dependent methyltransferase